MVNTEAVVFLISGIYILVLKSELKRIAQASKQAINVELVVK